MRVGLQSDALTDVSERFSVRPGPDHDGGAAGRATNCATYRTKRTILTAGIVVITRRCNKDRSRRHGVVGVGRCGRCGSKVLRLGVAHVHCRQKPCDERDGREEGEHRRPHSMRSSSALRQNTNGWL